MQQQRSLLYRTNQKLLLMISRRKFARWYSALWMSRRFAFIEKCRPSGSGSANRRSRRKRKRELASFKPISRFARQLQSFIDANMYAMTLTWRRRSPESTAGLSELGMSQRSATSPGSSTGCTSSTMISEIGTSEMAPVSIECSSALKCSIRTFPAGI